MTLTYTKKALDLAIDDARYLAKREKKPAWTVEVEDRPGIFQNITAAHCPLGRRVKAGWSPDGRRLDISAAGAPPRDSRKTYDVWARTDPPTVLGQVKGQTRSLAGVEAARQFGPNVLLSVAGHTSGAQIDQQIAREQRAEAKTQEKANRRNARQMKEAERERLAKQRENSKRVTAEREARERGRDRPTTP